MDGTGPFPPLSLPPPPPSPIHNGHHVRKWKLKVLYKVFISVITFIPHLQQSVGSKYYYYYYYYYDYYYDYYHY